VQLQEYKAWDVTTRVFHWLNVLCVLGLIAVGTAILNDEALGVSNDGKVILKTTHVWIGYVFVFNLLWRFVWGFIGGPYARWRAVLPFGRGYGTQLTGELAAIREGRSQNYIGHTPLGRIAVTVLLGALLLQGATGLILAGTDLYMPPFGKAIAANVAASGLDPSQLRPYAPETVDPEAYKAMRAMRAPVVETHEIIYFLLLGLIALHIFAVVATELKHGGNIISAMFSGRKTFAQPPADRPQ
jgi:Ni/Fe-hydrogenase 1 B-type cytochrome subunit